MVSPRKLPGNIYVRQLLLLASGILVCTVMLVIFRGTSPTVEKAPNDVERELAISRAADQYLVASTDRQRAEAAGKLRAAKDGSFSVALPESSEFFIILRAAAFITIFVLSWQIFAITSRQNKHGRFRQA